VSTTATAVRPGAGEPEILAHFGIDASALLGSGGESRVFALDDERVLRIFGGTFGEDAGFWRLVDMLDGFPPDLLGVQTPQVLDRGQIGGQQFTVDRRIPGESLDRWLSRPHPTELRRQVLLDHLDVASRLQQLPVDDEGFRVIALPDRVPADASLVDLLRAQAEVGIHYSDGLLAAAMPDLGHQCERLFDELSRRDVAPRLVHADYFPGNVMVHEGRLSGVLDFSVHTLAADPVMDQVAAVCFLDQVRYPEASADVAWLEQELRGRLGADEWLIGAYRRWYGLYYSMDHALIDWAVRQFHTG